MTTLDVLKAARKKIEKPENWCKRYFALNASGYECLSTSPNACRWCLTGAVNSVIGPEALPEPRLIAALDALATSNPGIRGSLAQFNDRQCITHADVLAALDRAIAALSNDATQKMEIK